jgi:hypothetical protein
MNEAAHGVGANQSKQPEHEQDYEDSPEHRDFLSVEVLPHFVSHNLVALVELEVCAGKTSHLFSGEHK